jgi:hypothetical protein
VIAGSSRDSPQAAKSKSLDSRKSSRLLVIPQTSFNQNVDFRRRGAYNDFVYTVIVFFMVVCCTFVQPESILINCSLMPN